LWTQAVEAQGAVNLLLDLTGFYAMADCAERHEVMDRARELRRETRALHDAMCADE
jgi:hypothetical protein